jgi:pimeloyl-ACP methyl ester carboxylesterase
VFASGGDASSGNCLIFSSLLEGDSNGAPHPDPTAYRKKFTGKYAHRTITGGIGHNLPQEAPQAFAEAIIEVAIG